MKSKIPLISLGIAFFLFFVWQLYVVWSDNIMRQVFPDFSDNNPLAFIPAPVYWDYYIEPNKDNLKTEWLKNYKLRDIILSDTEPNVADINTISLKDIAGVYYFGDGLGVNCSLVLSAQGEFTFIWTGCLGIYDKNKGTAAIKDGILHIEPNKPNVREGFKGTPTDFFALHLGSRMYLIPINELGDFYRDVKSGREPRSDIHGMFYLRETDLNKPVKGRLVIPQQWTKYLTTQLEE